MDGLVASSKTKWTRFSVCDWPMVAKDPTSVRRVESQSNTRTLRLGWAKARPRPTAGARSMQSFRSTSRLRRSETVLQSRNAEEVATTKESLRWKLIAFVASMDGITAVVLLSRRYVCLHNRGYGVRRADTMMYMPASITKPPNIPKRIFGPRKALTSSQKPKRRAP